MEAQRWLDILEGKIKGLDIPTAEEAEQMEKMIASLERLEEMLVQIESTLQLKSALNKKVENLVTRIYHFTQPQEEEQPAEKTKVLEDTLIKIIKHAKLAARVLDALATSLQLPLEAAEKLREKDKEEGYADQGNQQEHKREIKERVDLQTILQPLGKLVQNIVEEKLGKTQLEEKQKEV